MMIGLGLVALIGIVVAVATKTDAPPTPDVQETNQTTPTSTESSTVTTPVPTVFYPLPNYAARVTKRAYGQYFTVNQADNLPCGGHFGGYHNGDDLEITSDELDTEVPVFAIAAGQVRQLSRVGGYGGLLIIEYNLGGQVVTANYGHVDLTQPKVTTGQTVTAGQIVGYLGANCSAETDGERKHLHFSVHKGATIDVKGYVQKQSDLDNWINPAEFLNNLSAAEPKA
jgi:murein DD-endopeptidase MepM/ murein hydrolase activator NlpD